MSRKAAKRGMASIEIVAILAIAGLIAAGGVIYLGMMRDDCYATQFVEQVNVLAMNVKALNEDLDVRAIIDSGADRHADALKAKSKISNPWGGEIRIEFIEARDAVPESPETPASPCGVRMTLTGIPDSPCESVMSTIPTSGLWLAARENRCSDGRNSISFDLVGAN